MKRMLTIHKHKHFPVAAVLISLSVLIFIVFKVNSQDGSSNSESSSSESSESTSAAEANASAAENSSTGATDDSSGNNIDNNPYGTPPFPGWVYRIEVGSWGPPTSNNPGGLTSSPPSPQPPIVGGTPSCPTTGQTCNGNYIYDHQLSCGTGGNTTYCNNGCDNNNGSPSAFGAYCSNPPAPIVRIWFTRD